MRSLVRPFQRPCRSVAPRVCWHVFTMPPSAGGSIPGALARCVAELVLPPFHDVLFVKCGGVDEMARLEPCV